MEAKVSAVLKHKGNRVVTVSPRQTIASVIEVLAEHRIGAVPVVNENGQLVGIVSERDIIRGISGHAGALLRLATNDP